MFYTLYAFLTRHSAPFLERLLAKRLAAGKEDILRINERKGLTQTPRPAGKLLWVHAASVGEAQSALILMQNLLGHAPTLHILVTTGTKTSAEMMAKNLPPRAFHQFYPLDHPLWTARFLDHWHPDAVLWMESELWPNMLEGVRTRHIPAALVNARLSHGSYKKWCLFKPFIKKILNVFSVILCQTHQDAESFTALGAQNVTVTGNLKYASAPLPAEDAALKLFNATVGTRPCWLYASTHQGEEALAARVHETLKQSLPDLLTILVPRHPDRREDILHTLEPFNLNIVLRGTDTALPHSNTDIYIADTIGELGLFYRVVPVTCIGRTFSADGGGGHNPIEPAQLHCAVLHGPHVQNLQEIFTEMAEAQAAICVKTESELTQALLSLLTQPERLAKQQHCAKLFTDEKKKIIHTVTDHLAPIFGALDLLDKSP